VKPIGKFLVQGEPAGGGGWGKEEGGGGGPGKEGGTEPPRNVISVGQAGVGKSNGERGVAQWKKEITGKSVGRATVVTAEPSPFSGSEIGLKGGEMRSSGT